MREVTVYRFDDSRNLRYQTKHPIGSVLERRTYERVNNYKDLLRRHGGSSCRMRRTPSTSSSTWVKAGRHTSRSRPGNVRRGSFRDATSLRRLVAEPRRGVMKNALDHSGYFACPLGAGFGHLVHDGRIHSRSPGHRDRGGADQCPSRSKGRVATMGCFSAQGPGREGGEHLRDNPVSANKRKGGRT
jgi:hypothetical protein